jgi:hypothetical protein
VRRRRDAARTNAAVAACETDRRESVGKTLSRDKAMDKLVPEVT